MKIKDVVSLGLRTDIYRIFFLSTLLLGIYGSVKGQDRPDPTDDDLKRLFDEYMTETTVGNDNKIKTSGRDLPVWFDATHTYANRTVASKVPGNDWLGNWAVDIIWQCPRTENGKLVSNWHPDIQENPEAVKVIPKDETSTKLVSRNVYAVINKSATVTLSSSASFVHWYVSDVNGNRLDDNLPFSIDWAESGTNIESERNLIKLNGDKDLLYLQGYYSTETNSAFKLCIRYDDDKKKWVLYNDPRKKEGSYTAETLGNWWSLWTKDYTNNNPTGGKTMDEFPSRAGKVRFTADQAGTYYIVSESSNDIDYINGPVWNSKDKTLTTPEIRSRVIYTVKVFATQEEYDEAVKNDPGYDETVEYFSGKYSNSPYESFEDYTIPKPSGMSELFYNYMTAMTKPNVYSKQDLPVWFDALYDYKNNTTKSNPNMDPHISKPHLNLLWTCSSTASTWHPDIMKIVNGEASATTVNIDRKSASSLSSQTETKEYSTGKSGCSIQLLEGGATSGNGFVHWFVSDEQGNPIYSPAFALDWADAPASGNANETSMRNAIKLNKSNDLFYLQGYSGTFKLCIKYDDHEWGQAADGLGNKWRLYNDERNTNTNGEWWSAWTSGPIKDSFPYRAGGVKFTTPTEEGTYYITCETSNDCGYINGPKWDGVSNTLTTPALSKRTIYKVIVKKESFSDGTPIPTKEDLEKVFNSFSASAAVNTTLPVWFNEWYNYDNNTNKEDPTETSGVKSLDLTWNCSSDASTWHPDLTSGKSVSVETKSVTKTVKGSTLSLQAKADGQFNLPDSEKKGFVHWYVSDENGNRMSLPAFELDWIDSPNANEASMRNALQLNSNQDLFYLRGYSGTFTLRMLYNQETGWYWDNGSLRSSSDSKWEGGARTDDAFPDRAAGVKFKAPLDAGTYYVTCEVSDATDYINGQVWDAETNKLTVPAIEQRTVYTLEVEGANEYFSGNYANGGTIPDNTIPKPWNMKELFKNYMTATTTGTKGGTSGRDLPKWFDELFNYDNNSTKSNPKMDGHIKKPQLDLQWTCSSTVSTWHPDIQEIVKNTAAVQVAVKSNTSASTVSKKRIEAYKVGSECTLSFSAAETGFVHWYVTNNSDGTPADNIDLPLEWMDSPTTNATSMRNAIQLNGRKDLLYLRGYSGTFKLCIKYDDHESTVDPDGLGDKWRLYNDERDITDPNTKGKTEGEWWSLWTNSSKKEDLFPGQAGGVKFTAPSTPGTYYIVCETSDKVGYADGPEWNAAAVTLTTPELAHRTIFEIRILSEEDYNNRLPNPTNERIKELLRQYQNEPKVWKDTNGQEHKTWSRRDLPTWFEECYTYSNAAHVVNNDMQRDDNGNYYQDIFWKCPNNVSTWHPDIVSKYKGSVSINIKTDDTAVTGNAFQEIYASEPADADANTVGGKRIRPKYLLLQESADETIDGFVHWYIADKDLKPITDAGFKLEWNGNQTDLSFERNAMNLNDGNDLVWLRGYYSDYDYTNADKVTVNRPGRFKLCIKYDETEHEWVLYNSDKDENYNGNWWSYWVEKEGSNQATTILEDKFPAAVGSVKFTIPKNPTIKDFYVVCDASANNNPSWDVTTGTLTTPQIQKRCIYHVKVLGKDEQRLPFKYTGSDGTVHEQERVIRTEDIDNSFISDEDQLKKEQNAILVSDAYTNADKYFMEHHAIYTPLNGNTTIRMTEALENYYTPKGEAYLTRWTIWDKDGKFLKKQQLSEGASGHNMFQYAFSDIEGLKAGIYYVTTEVRGHYEYMDGTGSGNDKVSSGKVWWPVNIYEVHLMDNAEPLSVEELNAKSNDEKYAYRQDSYLRKHNFLSISMTNFEENAEDAISLDTTPITPENNFKRQHMADVNSYYSMADIKNVIYRKVHRMSVGRGEYALYRTLNVKDISARDTWYSIAGADAAEGELNAMGQYQDYFAKGNYNRYTKNGSKYDVNVYDKLYENTEGKQSGYFMYVDATDDPGIITEIPITGLCENTTLLFRAWICDLTWTEDSLATGSHKSVHADVGFTIKKKKGTDTTASPVHNDAEDYTILARYYTGEVKNKPTQDEAMAKTLAGEDKLTAKWQQVVFQFTIPQGTLDDQYVLEISNNSSSSNGADYAIDQIGIYTSKPNIYVERKDNCEASKLIVSAPYETLQHNMGWTIEGGDQVVDENGLKNDFYVRRYHYGLFGNDPYKPLNEIKYAFNRGSIYIGFAEGTGTKIEWKDVDKEMIGVASGKADSAGLSKSIRIVVPSNLNAVKYFIPDVKAKDMTEEKAKLEAKKEEIRMNVRAMNDYLEDLKRGNSHMPDEYKENDSNRDNIQYIRDNIGKLCKLVRSTGSEATGIIEFEPLMIESIYEDAIMTEKSEAASVYKNCLTKLLGCIVVPRIRCPWWNSESGDMYMSELDVYETDLHFKDEIIDPTNPSQGSDNRYSGYYSAVLFNAELLQQANDTDADSVLVDLDSPCILARSFYILPSVLIYVNAELEVNTVTCEGSIHRLSAQLMASTNHGAEIKDLADLNADYTFDWFLGSQADYLTFEEDNKAILGSLSLHKLLGDLRNGLSEKDRLKALTVEDVENSTALNEEQKTLLKGLMAYPKMLVSGKKDVQFPMKQYVVAMPYVVWDEKVDPETVVYCDDAVIPVTLPAKEQEVPKITIGYNGVNSALRLGVQNITKRDAISGFPIGNIEYGVTGGGQHTLKPLKDGDVYLVMENDLYSVANLVLTAQSSQGSNNSMQITFKEKANKVTNDLTKKEEVDVESLFQEGETYTLLIPFAEYETADATSPIANSCEGYAYLPIKIVPEYLTWDGSVTDKSEDDGNWKQSTSSELYKGGTAANSVDDAGKAFTPLYFSKVTVQSNKALKITTLSDDHVNKNDMAVDLSSDNKIVVAPYYVNKVDQIYLKPEAKLKNQQELEYNKAWVEFELKKGQTYWMSSPLKDVYAGDMYAPSSTGRQETEAFSDIAYSSTTNNRYNPAFYQKAWNKGVNIYTNTEGSDKKSYSALQSNWSIEYNDVNVPYGLGKGFSISVEKDGSESALVRLPKSDKQYTYEQTQQLRSSSLLSKDESGKLASGDVRVMLEIKSEAEAWKDEGKDIADGDGTHFLLGNPYMYPLDMTKFFAGNTFLNRKYWTMKDGTVSVGTPDVAWDNNSSEGQIAPMQAFFVELTTPLSAGEKKEITFTTSMMQDEEGNTTKSIIAANPTLRLTAERNGSKSEAFIVQRDNASNGYHEQEDAIALVDEELLKEIPQVYSVSGSQVSGVNVVKSIQNIPLGVYSGVEKEDVTLTIEGMERFANTLYLYDAETKESIELSGESYTLHIGGSSHGRYFLRSIGTSVGDDAIQIYSAGASKVTVASTETIRRIEVVTMTGRIYRTMVPLRQVYTFDMPKGIYIVHAVTENMKASEKVRVR